ncbi:MAG: helix-turn-helix domain-containing protein [Prosthecobacter sp.]
MKSSIQTASPALTAAQPAPTPPPPQVELLTQVEMAQRLGITRRTLHTWVLNGTVPMIKIRGFCRFEPAKVWAALLQHEVRAGSKSSPSREGGLNAAATPGA